MAWRRWISGIKVVVLCHLGTLAGCGGSATETSEDRKSHGDGDTGDGDTAGDGDDHLAGDGDGVPPASGGSSAGSGGSLSGTGGEPIVCGDIAYPVGAFHIIGAPTENGECLATVEVTGSNVEPDITCSAAEDGCTCLMWSGTLVEGTNSVLVFDEGGAIVSSYSGSYTPFPAVPPCGGQVYETVEIYFMTFPSADQVSCEREGIVEYCAESETCCTCGCGSPGGGCLDEIACPPHEGPTCGLSQCRDGMICCSAGSGSCAKNPADCP